MVKEGSSAGVVFKLGKVTEALRFMFPLKNRQQFENCKQFKIEHSLQILQIKQIISPTIITATIENIILWWVWCTNKGTSVFFFAPSRSDNNCVSGMVKPCGIDGLFKILSMDNVPFISEWDSKVSSIGVKIVSMGGA